MNFPIFPEIPLSFYVKAEIILDKTPEDWEVLRSIQIVKSRRRLNYFLKNSCEMLLQKYYEKLLEFPNPEFQKILLDKFRKKLLKGLLETPTEDTKTLFQKKIVKKLGEEAVREIFERIAELSKQPL